MPSSDKGRATTVGKWLLATLVPASALAMGSLHTTVLVVITIAAAVACALLWMEPPSRSSRAARWVLVAFAVLLGATVLQTVPLPASLVRIIAPANADVWARALAPLREAGPSWHPVTLAPPATHVQIVRAVLYGCVFLGGLRVTASEGGAAFLERVIIGAATVVALSALAHAAVHAERVFGLYKPRDAYGYYANRLGPLLNPNHLAAYLNVAALVALGAALSRRGPLPRPLAIGAAVLLAGTAVWAGSRGGTGSLVVGTLLVAALAVFRRGLAAVRRAESTLIVVALVAAGIFFVLGASDEARGELADHDMSKMRLAWTTLRLVPMSPVVGVGRGAFETVFPAVRDGTTYVTFLATENIATQWLVEWGVPTTLVAASALAIAFRPRVALTPARAPLGAWVAIVMVVLHDLVDFHLEVPGVMVLVSVCAAIVTGGRAAVEEPRATSAARATRFRRVAVACAAASIPAVVLALPSIGHSLAEERAAVAASSADASVPDEQFRAQVRAAMMRYPSEPFFPLAGAVRAQLTGRESVIAWIGRALDRYPRFGRAHLVLARSLARRHPAQARLEYRLAYENEIGAREPAMLEASGLVNGSDDALELVPTGTDGVPVLDKLAATLAPRLPSTSAMLDAELIAREPEAPGALRRKVDAVVSDLTHAHPWCSPRTPPRRARPRAVRLASPPRARAGRERRRERGSGRARGRRRCRRRPARLPTRRRDARNRGARAASRRSCARPPPARRLRGIVRVCRCLRVGCVDRGAARQPRAGCHVLQESRGGGA